MVSGEEGRQATERGRTSKCLSVSKVGLHYALEHSLRDVHLLLITRGCVEGGNGKNKNQLRGWRWKKGKTTHRNQRVGDLGQAITFDELEQLVSDRRRVLPRKQTRSVRSAPKVSARQL